MTDTDNDILRVFQSRSQTKAFYNKISRVYDALSDRSEAPVRRAMVEVLRPRPGERILEIGFGTGHVLAALARSVGESGTVFGIDLSNERVRLSKTKLAGAGLLERCRLRTGDATRLPYAPASMDGICMSFTLELFDTPEIPSVLSACRRVLRPGGRLVVAGMSKEGSPGAIVSVFEWAHRHFPNFIDCRPIFVRRAVEQAGFQVIRAATRQMWVPVEIVLATLESDLYPPRHQAQRRAVMNP
jgi:ubiquinone/menaquinone biosynthesis C-methylase UbiE